MKGALVTGGAIRVGRALALALAADGYFVFVHHHSSTVEARRTVADIVAAGGRARALKADLSSARQAEALVGRCQAPALAPRVRVAGIAPGLTLRSGSQTDARFAEQHTQNPLGVGVTVDDLVRAMRFILQTPTFTGDTLIVDSGEHLTGRPRDIAFDRKVGAAGRTAPARKKA